MAGRLAKMKADRELELEREQQLSIFNSIDEAIYVADPDSYEVLYANKALKNGFGEVEGKKCYKALQGRHDPCPFCTNTLIFGKNIGKTHIWEFQNEVDRRWYRCIDRAIRWPDGRMVRYEMAIDVTDQKVLEEELKKGSEKIKRFAYSVSHDMKNPAISIHGLARLLLRKYGDILDDRGRQCCEQILSASQQIVDLVGKISTYVATTEHPLFIEKVDLNGIIQGIREEFHEQLQARGILLCDAGLLPEINADRLSMVRVLRNLLDNAFKYGGPGLHHLRIGYRDSDDKHVLCAEDDGVGISGDDTIKIFEWFNRKTDPGDIEGTGLGLAIVKEIAELHGGGVWIEHGKKRGSTFCFSISKHLKPSVR